MVSCLVGSFFAAKYLLSLHQSYPPYYGFLCMRFKQCWSQKIISTAQKTAGYAIGPPS